MLKGDFRSELVRFKSHTSSWVRFSWQVSFACLYGTKLTVSPWQGTLLQNYPCQLLYKENLFMCTTARKTWQVKIFVCTLCLWVISVLLICKCTEFTSHMNNDHWSKNVRYSHHIIRQGTLIIITYSFITSKLDSCNSILFGLPAVEIDKLQRVQNAAARLVVGGKKYDHVTPILKQLHWLSIRARIDFKILLITYKALNNQTPDYITELLDIYRPKRTLRSTSQNLLAVPQSNTKTYGERTFQVSAPKLWNSLPDYIRLSSSLGIFKGLVKTHLFRKYFD